MSQTRAAPLYCPYCGEEDLRPHEDSHAAWECRGCARVFSVKFVGLLVPRTSGSSGLEVAS
jgi:transposase-like protein